MQLKTWLKLIYLLLMVGCQNTFGQGPTGGDIRLITDKDIIFIDSAVDTTIKAYVMAIVTFKDSLTLEPVNMAIQMFRMKGLEQSFKRNKVDFMFVFEVPREDSLSDYERILLEKYLPKVDSIFINSRYEFIGKKKWIYGRKMAIAFPFKIKPKH